MKKEDKQVYTRGDVVVNKLKIGDTVYEYEFGHEIKTTVTIEPQRDENGLWSWTGETEDGEAVRYSVHEDYPHYAPKLYTYPAYLLNKCLR